MTQRTGDKERQLFDAALDLPDSERETFIQDACADDAQLADRLRRLLAANENADGALTPPARTGGGFTPTEIGAYRLLEIIGEGGMGTVYLAQQSEPVRRRVALKIIKLGMDTKEVIARFESERQALALMNHPNIARILDAGATDRGRPYFVMEYVPGIPLVAYCDKMNLTVEARLSLMALVCRAVQHAHQKGIIHRDIKPSNILVMDEDGTPVPKIIDFGVAKATHQRLSQTTVHTRLGLLIGTPAYMSPEQAEMTALDVDTRSDVYSLGSVLYELLVGTTPITELDTPSAGYGELQRIIRTVDPVAPSGRLTRLGEAARRAADNRSATVTALRNRLGGELDWLVLKALAKDPAKRYQTAISLAEDIERHLAKEPISAGPQSVLYKLRKFGARHRAGIAASVVIAAALLMGLALATVGFIQASHERDIAEQARSEAESVTHFLTDMLAAVDPVRQGRDVSVRDVLDEAARTVDSDVAASPLTRARLHGTIGETYRALGVYDRAETHLDARLALLREHLPALHPDRIGALHELARIYQRQARYEEAEDLFRQALDGRRQTLGETHNDTLESMNNLAVVYSFQHRHAEAIAILQRIYAIERESLGENHIDLTPNMHNLGLNFAKTGQMDQAADLLTRAVAIRERERGAEHPGTIISKISLADVYTWTGRTADAEALLRESAAAGTASLGIEHPYTLIARHRLGALLVVSGDVERAGDVLAPTLELRRRVLGESHLETLITAAELGRALFVQERQDEAFEYLEQAATRGATVARHDNLHVARFRVYYADYLRWAGRNDEAEAQLLSAHKTIGDDMSRHSPQTRWVRELMLRQLIEVYEGGNALERAQHFRSLLAGPVTP